MPDNNHHDHMLNAMNLSIRDHQKPPAAARWTGLGLFILLLALLTGCAGTARGKASSTYSYDASREVTDASRSQADAWIILRYPAVIEESAEAKYFEAYNRYAIGGTVKDDGWMSIDAENVARASIAKSNFYAMSLYRVLAEELPQYTVLLSPHLVYQEPEGQLASRPLLATESMPSVLTVDFVTYSFPDTEKMMDSPPLTFGDLVTPLAVVHSDHWMGPATNGLLLASESLMETAWQQSAQTAREEFEGRLALRPIDDSRSLDFISFLNGERARFAALPTKPAGGDRLTLAAVEDYPLEKIRLNDALMTNWIIEPQNDPFAVAFANGVGTRLEAALGRIDHDRATFSDRQKMLASFDPELAFAFLSQSADESVRARLALAEKLIEAERRFLAAQSESIYQGVYAGSFGTAMRELITAEYRNLEERRDIARRQNMATAVAILAAAGAVYAGSEVFDGGNYDPGMALLSDALLLGSFAAIETAIATNQLGDRVGESFLAQMAPAITEQVTVQVRLAEGSEEISARDYAEFREQTMALYQSRVRSLAVEIQTDCNFRHPEASSQGRWFGGCVNGLATGRGYGVIRTDDARQIEYVGEARSGTASGTGAMIIHNPTTSGATFFDGSFRDGRPDGTVRVVMPGEYPAWRRYDNGQDRGRADETDWQPYRFQ